MALMGVREYGRHRNVSHVAVLKALRSGRISQNADGWIDSEQADRDWAANTHPAPKAPHAIPVEATAGFARARTVREHYEALLTKLEYERRVTSLVNSGEVKLAALRTKQMLVKHMLGVADRVAELAALETNEHRVHAIIESAVREALTAFAKECTEWV